MFNICPPLNRDIMWSLDGCESEVDFKDEDFEEDEHFSEEGEI